MLKHIPFYASLLERPEKPTIGMVLVYGAIEAHSFGEKGCIASNKTIAQETGLKEKTVANAISLLNKYRWVIVHLDNNNHRTLIEPSLTIEPPFTVQGTPLPATRNIEYSNKNTVRENTNSEVEKELLKIINQVIGREFRTLPRGYKKTLDLFSLEEIKTSLTNLSADAWHSERLKTLKLDYLIRATTIDKFLSEEGVQKKEKKYGERLNLETGKYERYEL